MIILASASPRRRELMGLITKNFVVDPRSADESFDPELPVSRAVEQVALRKAMAAAAGHPDGTVVGADTVVALDGLVLGKPADKQDAARMLRLLSGRRHSVYTGVAIVSPLGQRLFSVRTGVRFSDLSDRQIDDYVATGEPMDKAGAYGIQGRGALLVRGIAGDYYNVMGLPVCRLAEELREFDARPEVCCL